MHNKKPLVISVCILLILCLALAAIVLLGGWKIKITLHGDSPMTLSYGTKWEDPGGVRHRVPGGFHRRAHLPFWRQPEG